MQQSNSTNVNSAISVFRRPSYNKKKDAEEGKILPDIAIGIDGGNDKKLMYSSVAREDAGIDISVASNLADSSRPTSPIKPS